MTFPSLADEVALVLIRLISDRCVSPGAFGAALIRHCHQPGTLSGAMATGAASTLPALPQFAHEVFPPHITPS